MQKRRGFFTSLAATLGLTFASLFTPLSGNMAYAAPSDSSSSSDSSSANTSSSTTASPSTSDSPSASTSSKTHPPLVITSLGDKVLPSEGILTAQVRFTNTSAEAVTLKSFILNVENRFVSNRSELVKFLGGQSNTSLTTRATSSETRTVQPGESIETTLSWAYDSLAYGNDTWGARGVEIKAVTQNETFSDRSFVVVSPAHQIQQAPLSAVISMGMDQSIPWNFKDHLSQALVESQGEKSEESPSSEASSASPASTPSSPSSAPTSSASKDSLTGDSLTGQIESARKDLLQRLQTLAIPGVTFSLDSTAANLLDRNDVVNLSSFGAQLVLGASANANISALTRFCSGNKECLRTWTSAGSAISANQAAQLGVEADFSVLGAPAETSALQEAGITRGLISASALPTDDDKYSTPSARTSANGIPMLVSDSAMDAILAGAIPSSADADAVQEKTSGAFNATFDSLHARQLALALSATTYRERPNDPRLMVVHSNDSAVSREVIASLMAAPWVKGVNLNEAFSLDESPAKRVPLASLSSGMQSGIQGKNTEEKLSDSLDSLLPSMLTSVEGAQNLYRHIASVSENDEIAQKVINQRISALISSQWNKDERQNAVNSFEAEARQIIQGITAQDSSIINVISSNTEIPITVENPLPVAINVKVGIRSWDPRLNADKTIDVRIPARSSSKVRIPVKAFGSGNITAQVRISDKAGNAIGNTTNLSLRIRANWEDIGTFLFCGFFLLLLLLGLWKSLRKGRRSQPLSPEEARIARIQVIEVEKRDP